MNISEVQRFRKKPVVIEAWHYPDEPTVYDHAFFHRWVAMFGGCTETRLTDGGVGNYIITLEGAMRVSPGDWIIKGVAGEFYPCKPDIFEASYERA